MAETEAIIHISATGADEASSALGSVTNAMGGIGAQHNDLVGKFSQRFEHVGLQLFAGEALRASGVGMETRAVVSTLGLALSSVAGAFGEAAAPIFLVVAAFTAVAGIVAKVVQHHKDLQDQLEKTNKSTEDQLEKTNATIRSIDAYRAVAGSVPPQLDAWERSERALMKAQVERQVAGDQAQLAELLRLVTEEKKHQENLQQQIQSQESLLDSLKRMQVSQEVIIAQAAQLKKLTDEYNAGKMAAAEHRARVDELRASIALLQSDGTGNIEKLTEALKTSASEADKETKEFQQMAEEHVKSVQSEADAETKRFQQWAKVRDEQLKKSKEFHNSEVEMEEQANESRLKSDQKYDKDMYEAGVAVHNQLVKSFGDAVAKMIVEGGNFADAMKSAFKNMAEQIISDIIRIEIEWAVLQAMGFPMGGGGFIGGMFGGSFAEGGSVIVDRPTAFIAGEGGQPEIATFTPLSKLGAGASSISDLGGSGSNIQIGTVQTIVNGVDDPDAIADQVGRKIIERIRGMGEQNFVRSF